MVATAEQNVTFVNVFGDGRIRSIEFSEGLTPRQLAERHGVNLNNAVIKVNGNGVDNPDQPLSPNDRVSATPTKMAGARS